MTGFDRLSYQSRWLQVAPERKFLLWLLLMALAFTLPAWGQALTLALTAALTCWLLRVSFWRWCSLAMLVGLLFTRVLLRYQQMSTALDIKLYQGDFHL